MDSIALSCPQCRSAVATRDEVARCSTGHEFEIEEGTINFLGVLEPNANLGALDHACEASGIGPRTEGFIVPWLHRHFGPDLSAVKLLEDGAGGGAQVLELAEHGVDAYGIDPGHRSKQWKALPLKGRLFIADGVALPFPDCTFDAVTSSGVLEHVGEPRPVPQMDPFQGQYMREILRVLKPGGAALIAHPNGAHPIDFWHFYRAGARLHRPYEKWMPDVYQVRRWVRSSPERHEIEFLSPEGYLAFDRVKAHWYGRTFAGSMQMLFHAMTRLPFLARTWLNPWLVTEIRRVE